MASQWRITVLVMMNLASWSKEDLHGHLLLSEFLQIEN
jgi:hypothetical protein